MDCYRQKEEKVPWAIVISGGEGRGTHKKTKQNTREGKVPSCSRELELINVERITELENHHLGTTMTETVSSKNHQRMRRRVGESLGRRRGLCLVSCVIRLNHRGHRSFPGRPAPSKVNRPSEEDTTSLLWWLLPKCIT